MPREKRRKRDLIQSWFDSDPERFADICIKEIDDLYCNVCERFINSSSKTRVTDHLNGHASSRMKIEDSIFSYELTEAFVASNIPLNKLYNPTLRGFLEKYTNRIIPRPETLRKVYVNKVYYGVVQSIREKIGNNLVYFIVDEKTDACGPSVLFFFIGALTSCSGGKSYLLATKVLDKTNQETIVNFVFECFNILWPRKDASDKILLMISDSSTYMLRAGQILAQKYRKMIHFTCAAYALNRVAKKIRDIFPLVDTFISDVKKIFTKVPTTTEIFRKSLPDISSPEPLITNSKTWLETVAWCAEYFNVIKDVIDKLDAEGRMNDTIKIVKDLLKDQSLYDDIFYINNCYGFLIGAIERLESHGLSLNEQFTILESVKKNIVYGQHISPANNVVKEELQSILKENPGYSVLENIWKVLAGICDELPPNILMYKSCLKNFLYCPLSSVDSERSFSLCNLILSEKRRRFRAENLERHVVIYFNLQSV